MDNLINEEIISQIPDYELIQDIQSVQINILQEIINICNRHSIKFILVWGTLLGAVRHKGFIPWDDDLDIAMKRDDYERFKQAALQELPEHLFFQDYITDEGFHGLIAKVRDSRTCIVENGYRNVKNMNHGIFVDIFVGDYYEDCFSSKIKRNIIKLLRYMVGFKVVPCNKLYRFASHFFIKKQSFDLLHKILQTLDPHGKKKFYLIDNQIAIPADNFDDTIEAPYEGLTVNIPRNYHKYLSEKYGDYMQLPPVSDRKGRHMTELTSTTQSYKELLNIQK